MKEHEPAVAVQHVNRAMEIDNAIKYPDIPEVKNRMTRYLLLTHLRLVQTVELLKKEPEYSIDSIVMDSGFGTRTTFYRLYVDRFGITPAQYRKVLKTEQLTDIES